MRTAIVVMQRGIQTARSMDRSSTTLQPARAQRSAASTHWMHRHCPALCWVLPRARCRTADVFGALALILVVAGCKLLGSCRWAGAAPRWTSRRACCMNKAWRVAGELNR